LGIQKVLAAPADGYYQLLGTPMELVMAPLALSAVKFKPEEVRLASLLGRTSIGLAVRNREGVELGEVTELLSTGPQTVLVLSQANSDPEGKPIERMIPFVNAYVDQVDLAGRQILVDWQADY
jgi:hypothetical protein